MNSASKYLVSASVVLLGLAVAAGFLDYASTSAALLGASAILGAVGIGVAVMLPRLGDR